MSVEGGQLGRALLIGLFVLWVVRHTRLFCRTDKVIVRLVFLAFAVHAFTDNLLIATTACVFFTFATGVFARPREQQGWLGQGSSSRLKPFGGSNTPSGGAP